MDNQQTAEKMRVNLVTGLDKNPPVTKLLNVIGQKSVTKRLEFFLSSHKPGMVFPSMLFTGSHGLGKNYVAKILSKNLKRRYLEINCSTLETTEDLVEKVLLGDIIGDFPVTILFDEAHEMSKEVTAVLLTLLATSENNGNILEYRGVEIFYDMTKINTILSTTDSFRIFSPLISRCEQIYFKSYNNDELIEMLKFYTPNIEFIGFSDDKLYELAYACRGRGRDTYALAQKIKRCCSGSNTFSVGGWEELKNIFGIYPMGLKEEEIKLMRIIRAEGVISCAGLAARMMVGEKNITEEIEIRPKELGLINNTTRGRALTPSGEMYFDKLLMESKKESKDEIGAL